MIGRVKVEIALSVGNANDGNGLSVRRPLESLNAVEIDIRQTLLVAAVDIQQEDRIRLASLRCQRHTLGVRRPTQPRREQMQLLEVRAGAAAIRSEEHTS